jgi:hypothetical protein
MQNGLTFNTAADKQNYFKAEQTRARVLRVASAAARMDASKADWSGQEPDDKIVLDKAWVKGDGFKARFTGQLTLQRPSGSDGKGGDPKPVDMHFDVSRRFLRPDAWFNGIPGKRYVITTEENGNRKFSIGHDGDYGDWFEYAYEGPDGQLLNPQPK